MVKDYFTAKDVAEIFDIYEISAEELINGVIDFEPEELLLLANIAGISLDELLAD